MQSLDEAVEEDQAPAAMSGITCKALAKLIQEETRSLLADAIREIGNGREMNGLNRMVKRELLTLQHMALEAVSSLPGDTLINEASQVAGFCQSISERVEAIAGSIEDSRPYRTKPGVQQRRSRVSKADVRTHTRVAHLIRSAWRKAQDRFHDRYKLHSEMIV